MFRRVTVIVAVVVVVRAIYKGGAGCKSPLKMATAPPEIRVRGAV